MEPVFEDLYWDMDKTIKRRYAEEKRYIDAHARIEKANQELSRRLKGEEHELLTDFMEALEIAVGCTNASSFEAGFSLCAHISMALQKEREADML